MRYTIRPYISFFLANHDRRFQMYVKDHEKFVVTRLEEHVLDVTEQYILGSVSVCLVGISINDKAYRFSVFPREIGSEAHSDESPLPQASACRQGRAARKLQEACVVSDLSSRPGRLAR